MTDEQAQMALKSRALVGTGDIAIRGGSCLFSTGQLIKRVKVKGSKLRHFLFRDRWGEIKLTRPASSFISIE